jgi:hypothetical protein
MQALITQYLWVIYILLAWTVVWKGIALWKSARNSHKVWFIIILVANTLSILDIIYILFFSKKKGEETEGFQNGPTILSNGKRIV